MGLQTDVAGRLDLPGLEGLLGDLSSAGSTLAGMELPLDPDALAGEAGEGIDASGVAAAVGSVAEELGAALEGLDAPGAALAPVEEALAAVEMVSSADLPGVVEGLISRLEESFDPQGAGGIAAALTALMEETRTAPEGRALGTVLSSLVEALGAGSTLRDAPLAELPAAVNDAVRLLGGLMALETMLGEGERLAGILASRLEPAAVEAELDTIRAGVDGGAQAIRDRIGHLDPEDDGAVAAVEADLRALAGSLRGSARAVSEALGFGEATLVYLNASGLRTRAGEGAAVLRRVRLDVVERAATWLRDTLAPILSAEIQGLPPRSLADLVELLEDRIEDVAADVREADLSPLTNSVDEGLGAITDVTGELEQAVTTARDALVGAVEAVEDAVAAVPVERVVRAIRSLLEDVEAAMARVTEVVAGAQEALEDVATTVTGVLDDVEAALDAFRDAARALFDELADALDALNLDQAVGTLTGGVEDFARTLGSVELAPYFDEAVGAVDTATDVVEAVPLDLLPDDMEDDLADAVRPIREVELAAFVAEVESIVGIGPDGEFTFRPEIEDAVAEVQATYDAVIREIEEFDLPGRVASLDEALDGFAEEVRAVDLDVALQPLDEALDALRSAVEAADPSVVLDPVREAFAMALQAVDAYRPDLLLEPLDRRVDEAREGLMEATQLREWRARVDDASERAREILEMVDPEALRPLLVRAVSELRLLLTQVPDLRLDGGLGTLVSALVAGSGIRVRSGAWSAVRGWLRASGASGTAALEAKVGTIRRDVLRTRAAVAVVDLDALRLLVAGGLEGLTQSVAAVPDAGVRARLEGALTALDLQASLQEMEANRQGYLEALDAAADDLEALGRTGFSEVDDAVARLTRALAPAAELRASLQGLLEPAGVDLSRGLRGVMEDLVGEVDGDELADLLLPLADAVRDRMEELLDLVAIPLGEALDDLVAVVEAVDLSPLRDALAEVHARVRGHLVSLSPDALLGETLTAYEELRAALLDFDPVEAIRTVLEALRETVARVLEKLDVDELLARPLEVYERILASLGSLDLEALLAPVLDRLDDLATQLDEGLDRTVDSFGRLQAALPAV